MLVNSRRKIDNVEISICFCQFVFMKGNIYLHKYLIKFMNIFTFINKIYCIIILL